MGCQPENDAVWGTEWHFTTAGSVAEGKCPGLSESSGNFICMYIMYVHHTLPIVCPYRFSS